MMVVMMVVVVMMMPNDADMMMVVMMTDPDRDLGHFGLFAGLLFAEAGIVGL